MSSLRRPPTGKELAVAFLTVVILGAAAMMCLCVTGCAVPGSGTLQGASRLWICDVVRHPGTPQISLVPANGGWSRIYLYAPGMDLDDLAWVLAAVQEDFPFYEVVASAHHPPPEYGYLSVLLTNSPDSGPNGELGLAWVHLARATVYAGHIRTASGDDSGGSWRRCVANVAAHELGHLLGMGHSREPYDLMSPQTTMGFCCCANQEWLDVDHSIVDWETD